MNTSTRSNRKALEKNSEGHTLVQQDTVETAGEAVPAVWGQNMTFEDVIEASGILKDRPPVEHGESGHPFYTVQPMQLLSWYPRAYLFPKFMDVEKCKHVISLAEKRLTPSGLALKRGDTSTNTQGIRTSQGTFLSRGSDPDGILAWIEDKIGM